jgi:hypothetical protein
MEQGSRVPGTRDRRNPTTGVVLSQPDTWPIKYRNEWLKQVVAASESTEFADDPPLMTSLSEVEIWASNVCNKPLNDVLLDNHSMWYNKIDRRWYWIPN